MPPQPPPNPFDQLRDLDDWLRRNRSKLVGAGVALALVVAALSSYYQVEPDEVGVVLRFGKHMRTSEPGPYFKLPFGIEQVVKVPVQRQLKMEFGFRTVHADIESQFERPRESIAEAEMLTGDLNVAIVEWIVQYRIADPEKYLFSFRDMESTLRLMTEATMRKVIGDHSIDEVLTGGRVGIEDQAKQELQELNTRYDTGIVIQQLKLQDVNAPESVRPALREVEESKQERERVINDAWAEYNREIPRARGQAEQLVQTSEGYAVERINRGKGDAERFRALMVEYRRAPDVTRMRLYLEAMDEVLAKAPNKVIVDAQVKSVLPFLNLPTSHKAPARGEP